MVIRVTIRPPRGPAVGEERAVAIANMTGEERQAAVDEAILVYADVASRAAHESNLVRLELERHESRMAEIERVARVVSVEAREIAKFAKALREHVSSVDARVVTLEQSDSMAPAPVREEMPSHHDWSEELSRLSTELTARVKDKRDPMTSDRAAAIAAGVVREAEDAHELGRWRWRKGWAQRMGTEIVKAALLLVLGYVASRWLLR
jgi:hypothetical protein